MEAQQLGQSTDQPHRATVDNPHVAELLEDDIVTIEELDGVSLTDPALADKDGIPLYDDAGLLDMYTLGEFIRRGIAESLHFNGIGFCKKRFNR